MPWAKWKWTLRWKCVLQPSVILGSISRTLWYLILSKWKWRKVLHCRDLCSCVHEIKVQFCCFTHCQTTYLLRLRVRESVAALILFCASTWVISSALVSLMETTQSPTPTPAWAAFPPGVSCGKNTRIQSEGYMKMFNGKL